MYFRSAATFWLFCLTFVSMHHNQFNNNNSCIGAVLDQQQQQQQMQDKSIAAAAVVAESISDTTAKLLFRVKLLQAQRNVTKNTTKSTTIPTKPRKPTQENEAIQVQKQQQQLQQHHHQHQHYKTKIDLKNEHEKKNSNNAGVGVADDDDILSDDNMLSASAVNNNESSNNKNIRTAAAAATASVLSAKRIVRNLKNFKYAGISDNFTNDFKENLAKLLANANDDAMSAPTSLTATAIGEIPITMTTTSPQELQQKQQQTYSKAAVNESIMASVHLPERRHIIPEKLQYTKEINIKQGQLMGIVRNFNAATGLRDVDQYLGLPYAEAPTSSRRFMPPGAPLPWQGLKIVRHLPPVCPQKLPDISIQGSGKMSLGLYKHLTRLLPYLRNESEDCLYLNVYVPRADGLEQSHPYPVIVYIHGESFEWNSGNAYDGSVLASYGEVIVVTVNYRLGVLGFMKPSIDENTVANFGLLDQIAALNWIQDNIASFGGDKSSVTLMGHSTGAACVNYLMISPVASGLFHRSILMSGSAMSDWAQSNHSLQLSMQIAHALNCPLNDDNEQMLSCLREKRYQDILKIPTSFPQFSTSLGPIVDGHVIPNQPYKVMGQYTEYFSRYDLLFGITESESYHALGALALEEGLRENERDNLLRFYMQSRFDVRPDLALAATLKKYNDVYNNPIKATNLEHRDVVLDILSDARVVGPLMQMGLFHADVNRRNYMYVFGHNSAAGPHASLPHSITGEELAFIFGAPLAPAGQFHNNNYSAQEKLLSEAVMAYWTNFAKTGNPKAPWKDTFINMHALEWDRYDLDWPEFNKRTQTYMNIGIPPSIGYKYRQIYMNFWNKELPDELNQIAAIQKQPYLHLQYPPSTQMPSQGAGSEVITGHMSKFGSRDYGAEDPVRTLKLLLQEPFNGGAGGGVSGMETAENMYNAQPTFGIAKQHTDDELYGGMNTMATNMLVHSGGGSGSETASSSSAAFYGITKSDATAAATTTANVGHNLIESNNNNDKQAEEVAKSETTIQLLIGLIVVFIVLNVIIYSTFLLQKKKKTKAMKRKLGGILSYDGATDDELKRSKQNCDGDESYVLDVVRKSNTYEAIKTERRSPINGFKMTRQLSTSTVDTHTKVCAWMSATLGATATKMPDKHNLTTKASNKSSSPTFSSIRDSNTSAGGGSFSKHVPPPHQVSVGVDATPQGRSNSVLCQEPIEVTKLKLDGGRNIIICQDVEVEDQELLTPQNCLDASRYTLMRQYSAATEACDAELPQYLPDHAMQIEHKHSRSDPVELYYNNICPGAAFIDDEKVTSFMGGVVEARKANQLLTDINVTSRDDDDDVMIDALTPEQQLMLIKRRNYPKVLPTTTARTTDSPPMTADYLCTIYKRNSLPPNSFMPLFGRQLPPAPPPRTISTLGRKPSIGARRNSNNITTSPLMLAKDCTVEEDEPEITQNTLIVGPIVPKSKHAAANEDESNDADCNNYSTLKRKCGAEIVRAEQEANVASNVNIQQSRHESDNDALLPASRLFSPNSSFKSFESARPSVAAKADDAKATNNIAEHHTEKVYNIEAAATAAKTSQLPTLTAVTNPAMSTSITTTTQDGSSNNSGAEDTPIYAESTKFAIKQNLTAAAAATGKTSCIPRIIQAATGQTTTTTPTKTSLFDVSTTTSSEEGLQTTVTTQQNATKDKQQQQQQQEQQQQILTNCSHVMPMKDNSNQMAATTMTLPNTNKMAPTTNTTAAATNSRIPQLSRNINAQQQQKEESLHKDISNVAATNTSALKAKLLTDSKSSSAADDTATLISNESTRTSSISSTSSTQSSASASTSSSSSTGTVRTELRQHK